MPLRLLTLVLLAFAAIPVRAAESYDNCAGYIDSLPATIATQGVWCLRKNLSTAMNDGVAIALVGNNITIDCNEFKIGGLAAGPGTHAVGIQAIDRQNITVRNCGVRGFRTGIDLFNGAGHLLEDNRLDNNVYTGIYSNGDYSLVRRNRIFDMGGSSAGGAYAVVVNGDAVENIIAGASSSAANYAPIGIVSLGDGALLRGNRIGGLQNAGTGGAIGIWILNGQGVRLEHNHLLNGGSATGSTGIAAGSNDVCVGNSVLQYAVARMGCPLGWGDVVTP